MKRVGLAGSRRNNRLFIVGSRKHRLHARADGIMLSFYKKLIRRVLDGEIKGIVGDNQISLVDLIELLRGGDITEKMIRNRVDYLQRTSYLKKNAQNDRILLSASGKTSLDVYAKIPVDSNARMKGHIKTYSEQPHLAPKTTELAQVCRCDY